MAVIRDVMPAFELFQPANVNDALTLLDRHGSNAWILAGGLDTFDWLKDRSKRTDVVIDLSQMGELRGIKEVEGGVEIGALTTLTEVVRHPVIREKFGLLMEAAELVASPQIRNQGTLGGNVSQDTRCWYYRSGWTCYRAGGNICYADTPTAINREHAILQADRCVAVSPSDTAPALIALDAKMVIRSRSWAGAQFYFEKVRDRQVWDFPLVNVASAMKASGGQIQQLRLAVGAVAATPLRLTAVETAVAGKPRNEETADMAGRLAVEGAQPLRYNGYKIPLMRNLVKRAIRGTGASATT